MVQVECFSVFISTPQFICGMAQEWDHVRLPNHAIISMVQSELFEVPVTVNETLLHIYVSFTLYCTFLVLIMSLVDR